MAEYSDYSPGAWEGHDFKSARRDYDVHVDRSYGDAKSKGVDPSSLVPDSITTQSSAPLIVVVDVTGSMGEWPAVMFSKLPYLEYEAKEYLGEDMEICWAAIGDANTTDDYPLQVRPFTKGTDLKDELEKLVIEGGGGGQGKETYELAALFFARNFSMPNAIRRPVIIFIGDEKPWPDVSVTHAKKWSRVDLEKTLLTKSIFEELKSRFSVYVIRKPYEQSSGDSMSSSDKEIRRTWSELLGEDHIADLPIADRVVDVIFGILAKETERVEYFKEEIEHRQLPEQVEVVYKSLNTVHQLPPGSDSKTAETGRSIMRGAGDGKPSKRLLD